MTKQQIADAQVQILRSLLFDAEHLLDVVEACRALARNPAPSTELNKGLVELGSTARKMKSTAAISIASWKLEMIAGQDWTK